MTPQNTVAIVYDFDQTLSPSYMQEDVIFPAFGINAESFWRRCVELVREHGYDNELAYMKVMLDTFGMDRPTNAQLRKLGSKLNFYKGLPEMFEQFRNNLLTEDAQTLGYGALAPVIKERESKHDHRQSNGRSNSAHQPKIHSDSASRNAEDVE